MQIWKTLALAGAALALVTVSAGCAARYDDGYYGNRYDNSYRDRQDGEYWHDRHNRDGWRDNDRHDVKRVRVCDGADCHWEYRER